MSEHLSEPWEWGVFEHGGPGESNDITIRPVGEFPHGLWVADVGRQHDDTAKANARRIVAAVNACAGIPTDELEGISLQALRAENARLRAALEAIGEYAASHATSSRIADHTAAAYSEQLITIATMARKALGSED